MIKVKQMKNLGKIYFAGSIRGGRSDVELYGQIIDYLKTYGDVLTEHIGDKKLTGNGEVVFNDTQIHDRDMDWLTKARLVVAEVTNASLGVGYELGRMVERNLWVPGFKKKKILCLYRPQVDKRLSAMINGSRGLENVCYQDFEQAKLMIDGFFENKRALSSTDKILEKVWDSVFYRKTS